MKKTLLIALVATVLFGCTKKDNAVPKTEHQTSDILGKWYYSTDTLDYYINNQYDRSDYNTRSHGDYFEFDADGKGKGTVDNGDGTFSLYDMTYTFSNNHLKIIQPEIKLGNYTIPSLTLDYTVRSLANNKLYVYTAYGVSYSINDKDMYSETRDSGHLIKKDNN